MKLIERMMVLAIVAMLVAASNAAADWPMWGGTLNRNMVSQMKGVKLDFDLREEKNVAWGVDLGSQTYGNPVGRRRESLCPGPIMVPATVPSTPRRMTKASCCVLTKKTGKFVWQLTREKLPSGRVNDWPLQGICSTPFIEGDRLWVVTNRCELMCVDTEGFHDGENDGKIQDEVDNEKEDADIVWNLDMIEELGVFPHNLATSSPVVVGDIVYLLTSQRSRRGAPGNPVSASPVFPGR